MVSIVNIFVKKELVNRLGIDKREAPDRPDQLCRYLASKGLLDGDMEVFTSGGMAMARFEDPSYIDRYRKFRGDPNYVMFVAEIGN